MDCSLTTGFSSPKTVLGTEFSIIPEGLAGRNIVFKKKKNTLSCIGSCSSTHCFKENLLLQRRATERENRPRLYA